LRSIKAQNYRSYEVVIVDGGSSDKTLEIVECYKHKILTLPQRKPHDVGLARNFGARYAEGEILSFIDADTVLPSDCLNVLDKYFQNPKVIGVMCKVLPLEGNSIEKILYECDNVLMNISNKIHIPLLSYFSCISYRREHFIKIGGFREDLNACEDYDLALRLSKHGKMIFTDKITIYTSPRRLREWTYLGYIARYFNYLFQYHIFGRIYGYHNAIR
jgi:glycosyltransferase involved in cell wall biosynthesis